MRNPQMRMMSLKHKEMNLRQLAHRMHIMITPTMDETNMCRTRTHENEVDGWAMELDAYP